MVGGLPLISLLSQVYVAFTIEADNEAERLVEHWTTASGSSKRGVWLTSMAMYLNCMRFVDRAGIKPDALASRARTSTNLKGMIRWGYLEFATDGTIRATKAGLASHNAWPPIIAEVERRWTERFGEATIAELRNSLLDIQRQFDVLLPDCLPILGYGLALRRERLVREAEPSGVLEGSPLIFLIAKATLAFGLAYERESTVSLAIGANVLRSVGPEGVLVKDLPRLSGASKEALAIAIGFLERTGRAVIEPDGRFKKILLTESGEGARKEYLRLVDEVEAEWAKRFGVNVVTRLRSALEAVVQDGGPGSLLFAALEPPPGGWRAKLPRRQTLPHFPLVLHRGGYPDGS